MPGQGSTSNAFPGTFPLDYGSNASFHDGHPVVGWIGEASSNVNTQTPVRFQDLLAEDGLLSSPHASAGTDQSLEERHSEPNVAPFQQNVNMSLGNGELTNVQSVLQGAISSALPHSVDLNATYEGNGLDAEQNMRAGLSLNPFKPDGLDADQTAPASDSSNSDQVVISSGIAGYVVEESEGGEGTLDGRRLSCKRRAPEDASGRLSLGDSSKSAKQAGSSQQQAVATQENAFTNLSISTPMNNHPNFSYSEQLGAGLAVGVGAAPVMHQPSSASGSGLGAGAGASSDMHLTSSAGLAGLAFGVGEAPVMHQPSSAAGSGLGAGAGPSSDMHLTSSAGLAFGVEAATVMHQPSSAAGSGLGAGAGASSDMHLTSSAVGQAEDSQRQIHLTTFANQQDFVPTNLSTWTTRNPHVQSPGQPPVLFPFDRVPNTSSAAEIVNSALSMQSLAHVPNSSQTLRPFQWNGATRSRTIVPSSYAFTVNGGDALHREGNSRDNLRNGMLLPELLRGNLSYISTNLNFANGTSFQGNIASSFRNGSSSNVHQPFAPTWFPQGNLGDQYAQRVSDIVNRTESQRQGSYSPIHLDASPATERELSARSGNVMPFQMPVGSGLAIRSERQTGGVPEMPVRPLTAAQRRSRLVSEVRNALALVRRGGSLQFEDVMVIDHSVLYGVPEEPDLHEDMRLDVDNMSYEELLALEEQIGNVCTGLSEDAILAHLKHQKYQILARGSPIEEEPCCICQEEYVNGEDLGKLDCGHDFHFDCIKQWLVQKNTCPICKMTGLQIRDH